MTQVSPPPGRIARAYGAAFLAFLAIDAVWLTQVGPDFYAAHIASHMAEAVNYTAAALFYLIYIAGIVGFAVLPSVTLRGALVRGACLGFVAYGTYDMTALAAFNNWPVIVTVVDMAWGTVLTGLVAAASWWVARPREFA